MKAIYIILILFMTTITVFSQSKESKKEISSNSALESKREKFDPKRDVEKDIANAVKEASSLNKRILLDVGGEWCIWCHRLDYFFLSNNDIYNLLHDNFITVKVNYSDENKNEVFLSKYPKVAGYPHIFILEKDGKLLHSQNTGDLESEKGYSRDKVIEFLNKWKLAKQSN